MTAEGTTPRRCSSARRRLVASAVVVVLLGVAGWLVSRAQDTTGGSTSGGSARATVRSHASPVTPRPASQPLAAPSTAATTTVPSTVPAPRVVRNLPTVSEDLSIVDRSRPLIRDGTELAPYRALPTVVWRPRAAGVWPLVVFVHGDDVGPMTYSRFCSTLASSGYVVAAPSFPLEDPSRGYGLDRADLPDEATDVSFVITTLLGGPLASSLARTEIAVAGHSDGADVALMVGYQTGKVDPRVRAIISDAPDPMTPPISAASTPLLLMQGSADNVVPYSASQTVFTQVSAPTYYLTLLGAGHLPPIAGGTPWTPVLDGAVADFLDATIAGRDPIDSLGPKLRASPLVHLEMARTG
jgi:dienelactone hydrolase